MPVQSRPVQGEEEQAFQHLVTAFCSKYGLSAEAYNNAKLQTIMLLYGESIPQSVQTKNVRSLIQDNPRVLTTPMLMEALKVKNVPDDAKNSMRGLTAFRNRLLTQAFKKGGLFTDCWNMSVNQNHCIESLQSEDGFLNDDQLRIRVEQIDGMESDAADMDRLEMLRLLDSKQLLARNEKLANYFYMQHKVVKTYMYNSIVDIVHRQTLDQLVLKASENRSVASRALNAWILECQSKLTDSEDVTFLNRTLNNLTFYQDWFAGNAERNPDIRDTSAWKKARPLMHHLSGGNDTNLTKWSNILVDLARQYQDNFQLMINGNIEHRMVAYIRRTALEKLPSAAVHRVDKTLCITYSGGYFPVSSIFQAIHDGYFMQGTFPAVVADCIKDVLSHVPHGKQPDFDPETAFDQNLVTFERFVQPVVTYYNDKYDTNKYKLTKKDLTNLLDELKLEYKKSDKVYTLINKVRVHLELHEEETEPAKEAYSAQTQYKELALSYRLKSLSTSKLPFHPKLLLLHLKLREEVPLPNIQREDKGSKKTRKEEVLPDQVCLANDADFAELRKRQNQGKDRGWSAAPITAMGRINIRIDTNVFESLKKDLQTDVSMDEFFGLTEAGLKKMRQRRNEVRKKCRKACRAKGSHAKQNKTNACKARCGLGGLPPQQKGWKLTSVMTDGVVLICHYERRQEAHHKKDTLTRLEHARLLYQKYEGKVRLIADDRGRVIMSLTAEKAKDGKTWSHKQIRRSQYYRRTGIDRYNVQLQNSKPKEIAAFEQAICGDGGWKARSEAQFLKTFDLYLAHHTTLFQHYSDKKFSLGKMWLWRRKRSYLQQRLGAIFFADRERRQVIYSQGDVHFASSGKGDAKGGAPTSKLDTELRTRVRQLTRADQQGKDTVWEIRMMKASERYTSQMCHKCQRKLDNIKDPETGNILRSWKCCSHCGANSHDNVRSSNPGLVVHRDKNAAKNQWEVTSNLVNALPRPEYLCRQVVTSKLVITPDEVSQNTLG